MSEAKNIGNNGQTGRSLQIVVFKLGGEDYGLTIDQIKEVVVTPRITKIPQAPSYVRGVANIRGNVIAIFDLEERFKLQNGGSDQGKKYTLVVEGEDVRMGLLVDDVPNTISVRESDLDESVGIISDSNFDAQYIKGVVKLGERLIILVDVFKVIDQEVANGINKRSVLA